MRSFSKKLAFALAAAMVVTAFAPAAQAKAADEMAINKSSQILYVNEGINHKGGDIAEAGKGNVSVYDFSVKNKPSDWKTAYTFKWSSSNEDVVTVKAGGVATAVGVGKATITCKVTEKATKEVTTLKTKVTVKANAYDVEITNADKYDGTVVELNGVVDLNRAMYDEDGNKTTKRGTLVTDYTRWIAEPATGVEIDQKTGKFTFTEAAEAGEYKLYCETYQSSKYTAATAKADAVVVEYVKADSFEVDQTASNGFNLVFSKEANVAIADVTVNKIIKVGASTGKLPMVVANVVVSQDKKTAAVSLFSNFENGATYEISVKGFDETVTLVPSIGAPTSMTIGSKSKLGSSLILTGDTPTELTYTLWDAEGNDVTNTATGYVVYSAANTTTADYYVDNGYLYIFKSGAEVVVNAEFHTGIYDNNAVEKTYKASGVFVGVDKAIESIASINMSLSKWSNALNNNAVAVDIGANGAPEVVVKIKTTAQGDWEQQYTNGGFITNLTAGGKTPQVRLRSSNPDVLDMQAANSNNVVLFKEGTAAILLELVTLNDDGSESVATVAALNVTVTGKCKVSGVVLPNGANLTVGAETTFNTAKLPAVAKDQYGFVWGFANWIKDANGVATFDKVSFADGTVISDKNGALDGSVVYLEPRSGANGWNDQVVVNGDALLAEMVAAGYVTIDGADWKVNGNKVTSVTKLLVIEATANNPADAKDTVKFTVNVTVKKPVGTSVYSVAAEGTTSGNIGRFNTPYDGNTSTEDAKKVAFKLFTKQNGVTTAQKTLEGVKPANNQVVSGTAVGSLFYTITRNNADISNLDAVEFDGSTVTVNYSTVDNGVISYKSNGKDMGAGQYVFQVYEVKHNASTGKDYFAFIGSASTNVTCDTGAYTLVRRTAESVASVDDASIRACFAINNRDGKLTENEYSVDKTVSNGYVHVKSITFYEGINATDAAPYTVNIGVSLKLQ